MVKWVGFGLRWPSEIQFDDSDGDLSLENTGNAGDLPVLLYPSESLEKFLTESTNWINLTRNGEPFMFMFKGF